MNKAKNHILVTGAHRSGTTWVGRTISEYPGVRYVHEPFNIDCPNVEMGIKVKNYFENCETSGQQDDIKKAFDKLLCPGCLEYLRRARSLRKGNKKLFPFVKELMASFSNPRMLIKDPIALFSAGWLYETYNLKVICMIRNPLAFVGSLKKQGWDHDFNRFLVQEDLMQGMLASFNDEVSRKVDGEGDFIDRVCLLWNILHFVILEYQKKHSSWLFVKHEDIAKNPGTEFEKIFDYLELDADRNVQAYIKEYTSSNNPREASSHNYQPRDSKGSLEIWKERLTPEEIFRVQVATNKTAEKFYKEDELLDKK